MLRSHVFGYIWLIFVIIFYIFSDHYIGLILLALTLLLGIILFLNIVLMKNKLDFTMSTTGTVHKGENGIIQVTVENNSVLPVAKVKVFLQFENELTKEVQDETVFLSLNIKGTKQLPLQLNSTYCGHIQINLKSIVYYDFLGIFYKEAPIEQTSYLYVLPNTYDMSIDFQDVEIGSVDQQVLEMNQKGNDGLEIFGIKEYTPEDNLKNVHWKLTSKFDELIVKELTKAVNHTFLVLIDLS